jgi:hypothetical protein
MRTTVDLNDQLLEAARRRAAQEGRSLTSVIEDALAALLAPRARRSERFALKVATERGQYIGGVEPADRDALYDVKEGRR